ncbi:O-antigen/teichoic acid export membrane protein [Paenibacillus rhizosphaerae]|uniref:O-antigen/teichoic acid export membrane protein n=1 Tax=Paenibacillus rhizosphaerae TaxID=297318 RepID=A0A839TTT1_9BACL|nr:oligosaccharide flippase family protein [Paenibacillus rhizosphaerae]MBB3129040.1 O-antigen/teichoic acid export membrane protein [Paenibacillus rhizosphaerae]
MVKHGLIYFIAKLFAGAVGFLSIVLYTRMLIPDEYGRYALVLVYVNLINSLLYQWFRLGLIRYIPRYHNDKGKYNKLLSTVIVCYLGCCLFTLLAGGILVFVGIQSAVQMAVTLFFLWTAAWFELSQAVQRSNLKPVRFTMMTGLKSAASLGFGVLALAMGYGEVGLLIGISLGTFVANVVFIREWNIRAGWSVDRSILVELVKYGLPLIISGGMAYIMQSIDRVMIGWLEDESAAGIYSVTFDFALQTVGMLMLIVNLSALPLVIRRLETEGYESAQGQLTQNYQLLLGISLPAVLGLTILSGNITGVIFGKDYAQEAAVILPFISFAMLFQGLKSYYTDNSFQLGRTTYLQAIPVLIGIVLNVVMNMVLIPRLGLTGAAISSLTAYLCSFLANWFVARSVFYLPLPHAESVKIIGSSLVMGLVLFLLKGQTGLLPLICQIAVGAVVYAAMFVILNIMNARTLLMRKLSVVRQKRLAKSDA